MILARLRKPKTISHLPRICIGKKPWCQGVSVLCAVTSRGIPAQGEMMCSQLPCRRAQRVLLGSSLFMGVGWLPCSRRSPLGAGLIGPRLLNQRSAISPHFETDLWLLICCSKSVGNTVVHCLPVQCLVSKARLKKRIEGRSQGEKGVSRGNTPSQGLPDLSIDTFTICLPIPLPPEFLERLWWFLRWRGMHMASMEKMQWM